MDELRRVIDQYELGLDLSGRPTEAVGSPRKGKGGEKTTSTSSTKGSKFEAVPDDSKPVFQDLHTLSMASSVRIRPVKRDGERKQ